MKKVNLKKGFKATIREAEASDAQDLLRYINIIAGESDNLTFGEGEFKMTVQQEADYLEAVKNTENSIYLIALVNNQIAGSANLNSGNRPRIKHLGEVSIAVKKQFWRIGLGNALMTYLIDWSKEKGLRKINLSVRTDNLSAIALYEKLGFVIEGKSTRGLYVDGEFIDLQQMGLEIDL